MKKVFTDSSVVTVAHFQNLLEVAGIASELRNANLGGAVGEIPFLEAWPELWVKKPLDYDRALEIIAQAQAPPEAGEDWQCTRCGNANQFHFAACWQCGAIDERRN